MAFARAEPLLAVLNGGRLLVAGGYDEEVERDVAVHSPGSGSWEPCTPLPSPRAGSAGPFAIDDRHSLWIGGSDTFERESRPAALLLDRDSAKVSEVSLQVALNSCVVELERGTFLVAGGQTRDGTLLATTEVVRVGLQY